MGIFEKFRPTKKKETEPQPVVEEIKTTEEQSFFKEAKKEAQKKLDNAREDAQKKFALYIENLRKLNEDPGNDGIKKQVDSDFLSWQHAQEEVKRLEG